MSRKTVMLMGIALCMAALGAQADQGRRLPIEPYSGLAPTQAQTAIALQASDATPYTYSIVAFPGTLNTFGVGMSPAAIWGPEGPGIELVGAEFFPDGLSQTGFAAHFSTQAGVTEAYTLLNDPAAPTPQQSYSVNDHGTVVGDYIDTNNVFHSYIFESGRFKIFSVPFSGATGTYSPAINNSGEIVGSWNDSVGNAHSYTWKDGKFESFDFPGASQSQFYYGINSAGDIVGSYADKNGDIHGFLRTGARYVAIDFPGSLYTNVSGINDSGEIVGVYCLTSQCVATGAGEMGFLLKGGVFTSLLIPGEAASSLQAINNHGVILGQYLDAAGYVYTFLARPQK